MTYTAVIRQRGQLTIPDFLREQFRWLNTGNAVEFETADDEVKIRPAGKTKKINWDEIWQGIKLCRSFKPRNANEKSASEFIIEDRYRH